MTGRKLHLFRLGYLAKIFFFFPRDEHSDADISRETIDISVANDKIQASNQKLKFWKAHNHHFGLYRLILVKDFPDKIDGNINKYNF